MPSHTEIQKSKVKKAKLFNFAVPFRTFLHFGGIYLEFRD